MIFRYFEELRKNIDKNDTTELERVKMLIESSKNELVSLGYEEFTLEMFWDVFVNELNQLASRTIEEMYLFITTYPIEFPLFFQIL